MTHMKRFNTPNIYPLKGKQGSYALTPKGPHPAERSIPLGIVLRDMLQVADSMREARTILNENEVLIDGIRQTNPQYTLGFMDVLSLPHQSYRFIITSDGAALQEIDDVDTKLCRITGKTTLPGGDTQVNLHDGKNIVEDTDASPGDTVVLSLPDQSIEDTIPFAEGSLVYITGGQHRGTTAAITDIRIVRGSNPNLITLNADDTTFETTAKHLYVIGEDSPEVEL